MYPSPVSSQSATIVVRTGGLTETDLALLAAGVITAPVMFLMLAYLPQADSFRDGLPVNWTGVLASVGIVAAIMMFQDDQIQVRRVEVDPEGVDFRFTIHSTYCRWSELFPSSRPPQAGIWAAESRKTGVLGGRWFRLTLDQSRALLNHPACPKWNLSPEVLSGLGMSERK